MGRNDSDDDEDEEDEEEEDEPKPSKPSAPSSSGFGSSSSGFGSSSSAFGASATPSAGFGAGAPTSSFGGGAGAFGSGFGGSSSMGAGPNSGGFGSSSSGGFGNSAAFGNSSPSSGFGSNAPSSFSPYGSSNAAASNPGMAAKNAKAASKESDEESEGDEDEDDDEDDEKAKKAKKKVPIPNVSVTSTVKKVKSVSISNPKTSKSKSVASGPQNRPSSRPESMSRREPTGFLEKGSATVLVPAPECRGRHRNKLWDAGGRIQKSTSSPYGIKRMPSPEIYNKVVTPDLSLWSTLNSDDHSNGQSKTGQSNGLSNNKCQKKLAVTTNHRQDPMENRLGSPLSRNNLHTPQSHQSPLGFEREKDQIIKQDNVNGQSPSNGLSSHSKNAELSPDKLLVSATNVMKPWEIALADSSAKRDKVLHQIMTSYTKRCKMLGSREQGAKTLGTEINLRILSAPSTPIQQKEMKIGNFASDIYNFSFSNPKRPNSSKPSSRSMKCVSAAEDSKHGRDYNCKLNQKEVRNGRLSDNNLRNRGRSDEVKKNGKNGSAATNKSTGRTLNPNQLGDATRCSSISDVSGSDHSEGGKNILQEGGGNINLSENMLKNPELEVSKSETMDEHLNVSVALAATSTDDIGVANAQHKSQDDINAMNISSLGNSHTAVPHTGISSGECARGNQDEGSNDGDDDEDEEAGEGAGVAQSTNVPNVSVGGLNPEPSVTASPSLHTSSNQMVPEVHNEEASEGEGEEEDEEDG